MSVIDWVVMISAVILLALTVTALILYPTWLGKERKPYNIAGWVASIIQSVLIVIIVGRVFGWW